MSKNKATQKQLDELNEIIEELKKEKPQEDIDNFIEDVSSLSKQYGFSLAKAFQILLNRVYNGK